MRKLLIMTLLSSMTLLAACEKKPEDNTQIPNPLVTYETMEEAAEKCSFDLSLPFDSVDSITLINNELLQVTYEDLTIRKASGNEDISGDYNIYSFETEETIDETKVIMKGENEATVKSATWLKGEYAYSINCEGKSIDKIIDLVQNIQ